MLFIPNFINWSISLSKYLNTYKIDTVFCIIIYLSTFINYILKPSNQQLKLVILHIYWYFKYYKIPVICSFDLLEKPQEITEFLDFPFIGFNNWRKRLAFCNHLYTSHSSVCAYFYPQNTFLCNFLWLKYLYYIH